MVGTAFQPTLDDLLSRGPAQEALHERAAEAARQQFGREVFVRAVVEISNHCRENCHYCGMRRENRSLERYRARVDSLAEILRDRRPQSVTDINLQAGEDPVAVREVALPLIRLLRRETTLGISVCLGTLDPATYNALREAGASVYILKFEMADGVAYELREGPGTLSERLDHIRWLAANGWMVSSGLIAGVEGPAPERLLASCHMAGSLPLIGCSVSPFVPGESTPMAGVPAGDLDLALNSMALLRLMQPRWVIPAVSALNIGHPGIGYQRGLATGANLVTINLTPPELRGDYLLYRRERIIMDEERILAAIQAAGLTPSRTGLVNHLLQRRPATRPLPEPA